MEIQPRQELVVWVHSLRQVRQLRRYGSVLYTSRRMKYVLIYVDAEEVDDVTEKISRLRFVRSVEPSHRNELDPEAGKAIERGTLVKPRVGADDDD
ncbi:YlbG family protein [Lacticaseibacillus hulanensis]|uniref:YlbG family protein n=1 Tax=Lacticaseibacillus hulanensis TaxID=2493111 RepID=UPI001F4D7722|nr:YlbG family protein [Lacticaseibacillus hulanensis]